MTTCVLTVKKSPVLEESLKFPLQPGEHFMGRVPQGPDSLTVPDKSASRKHARLTMKEDGTVVLEDCNSGNGTFVNAKRIREAVTLKMGDTIQIGDTYLKLERATEEEVKESDATQVMSASDIKNIQEHVSDDKTAPGSEVSSGQATQIKKQLAPLLKKKSVRITLACCLVLFILALLLKLLGGKSEGIQLPGPASLTKVHRVTSEGYRFKHPPGWKRISKSTRDAFGYTYFYRSTLHMGGRVAGRDVHFLVDILRGLPPILSLKEMVDTKKDRFPRMIAHGKQLLQQEVIQVAGQEAILGISEPFEHQGITIQTIEVFMIDKNSRYLLFGAAPESLLPSLVPLFRGMFASLMLDPFVEGELKKPANLRHEVKVMKQTSENLVENKDIAPENLYQAIKLYRKSALLLNKYDFRIQDPMRLELNTQFQDATTMLKTHYDDLKFKLDRDIKLKDWQGAYHTSRQIMSLIPDSDDDRYKHAYKYYQYYLQVSGQT